MKTYLALTLLILAAVSFMSAAQQADQQTSVLHSEIERLYGFQPHMLTPEQISRKSDELDMFWAKVESKPDTYLPSLRQELADQTNPSFFLYDCSTLLIRLSDKPADWKLALAAIPHSDLRDIQYKDYFSFVHRLAVKGADTTAAALHILDAPDFKVIVPQHALTLGQNYSLIYMVLPTDQEFWIGPVVERIHTERDETAQKSLLLLLWYAQVPESDKAIAEFASDTSKPAPSRSYANELLQRKEKLTSADRASAKDTGEASLREQRRIRMKSVSDEALYDLDSYTAKILASRQ